ncbi:MAG TPA: radical SAM protein [Thermoanaerobaculia bacterium]|jgi:MoaA/NifB/PqqE/SkfB family radical SAM enzyme|nr:radical SAM protein [Thermoanaerobaculia bacterium]
MSTITENRALNNAEVRAGAVRLQSSPLQVNVELTGICNIDPPCLFCSGKNFGHNYRPLDVSHLDKYSSLLDRCEHVNEDSFGEPLGHSGLIEVAERFTGNGQVFSFVTNGLLLSPAKADRLAACGPRLGIHVSFNAATEKTFYQLTGKDFTRVVENVRYYAETYRRLNQGAPPDLILTFIVMKINRHEVADFLHLVRELGARALLAPLHDRPSVPLGHFGYDFVYTDEMLPYGELKEIGQAATALSTELGISCILQWDAERDSAIRGFSEPGVATPCLIPWRYLFLQEHSKKVFGCPYHRIPFGDLATAELPEIWNGETAQDLRRSLAAGEIPKFCRDHSAGCPLVMAAEDSRVERKIEDWIVVGTNDLEHLLAGWYPLEHVAEPIRWTSAKSDFLLRTKGRTRLVVEALSWGKEPVEGWVEIEGRRLGGFQVDGSGWHELAFDLPDLPGGEATHGTIGTDEPWSPAALGLSADTRQLGVAVRRIWAE